MADFDLSFRPLEMQQGSGGFSLGTPDLASGAGIAGVAGAETIMGMSPASFAAMGGLLAQAIGGDTPGGRVGQVASALGQTQIKAMMAQKAQKDQQAFLKDLLGNNGDLSKLTPEHAKVLGLAPNLLLGSGPSGSTGLETGTMTLGKMDLRNSPSLY